MKEKPAVETKETQPERSRHEVLAEAKKLWGVDVANSAQQVAQFCEADNEQHARAAFKLLTERIEKASAALNSAFPETK